VVRPIARLDEIWRVDKPSADNLRTSGIFRLGNLFIGLPSRQKNGK
jgi:hypothetical protein